MPAINMSSIMSKVGAYSRSVGGKLRMRECIQNYATSGKSKTAAGGKVMTEDKMLEAASKMITILRMTANEYGLPESVRRHFDSLECSSPIRLRDGSTVVYIYFDDRFDGGLRRESLEDGDGGHTGEGINNIIALFNNGAHASKYVYGWWNGHKPHGEALARSGGQLDADYAWVRSKKDRDALHFIQQAVSDFNGNYGYEYDVTAVAGDEYL